MGYSTAYKDPGFMWTEGIDLKDRSAGLMSAPEEQPQSPVSSAREAGAAKEEQACL